MTETKTLKNFVGGEYVDASNGRTYDLVNPATGQTFAQAPISEQADIDRAFEAAERAFETWRETTPSERQLALLRLADSIEDRAWHRVPDRRGHSSPVIPRGSGDPLPQVSARDLKRDQCGPC